MFGQPSIDTTGLNIRCVTTGYNTNPVWNIQPSRDDIIRLKPNAIITLPFRQCDQPIGPNAKSVAAMVMILQAHLSMVSNGHHCQRTLIFSRQPG